MKCPKCGSGNTRVERRIDGRMECLNCGLDIRAHNKHQDSLLKSKIEQVCDKPNINLISPEDLLDYIKDNLRVELHPESEETRVINTQIHIVLVPAKVKLYFGDELISEG